MVIFVDSIYILSSRPQKQPLSVNKTEHRTKLGHPAAESTAIKWDGLEDACNGGWSWWYGQEL